MNTNAAEELFGLVVTHKKPQCEKAQWYSNETS